MIFFLAHPHGFVLNQLINQCFNRFDQSINFLFENVQFVTRIIIIHYSTKLHKELRKFCASIKLWEQIRTQYTS